MKLTPVQRRFRTAWRGYDRREVDAFVRQLALQYEARVQDLQARLAEREHDIDRVRIIGQTLEQWLESIVPTLTAMQTALRSGAAWPHPAAASPPNATRSSPAHKSATGRWIPTPRLAYTLLIALGVAMVGGLVDTYFGIPAALKFGAANQPTVPARAMMDTAVGQGATSIERPETGSATSQGVIPPTVATPPVATPVGPAQEAAPSLGTLSRPQDDPVSGLMIVLDARELCWIQHKVRSRTRPRFL